MSCRYSNKLRLTTAEQFRHVFQHAIKRQSHGLRLFAKFNNQCYPRLGMIVSKREIAKAVSRNRMKRCIRESFRRNQREIAGFDIIIMVNRQCLNLSNTDINQNLRNLWSYLATFLGDCPAV